MHCQDATAVNGGRTETASVKEKWNAVIKQEKFYRRHFNVDLKRYREKSRLSNSSWNGGVINYLIL